MKSKGIIRNINDENIMVEPLSSDLDEGASCCSSGGCGSCGHNSNARWMKVDNPDDLTLKSGNFVEIEVPSSQVFLAVLRIIIIPLSLFGIMYFAAINSFNLGEPAAIASGSAGVVAALLVNFFFRKKTSVRETPRIVRVL